MAKRLTLFSLRLLSVNAVTVLIAFFIMTPMFSAWQNTAFQWGVTLVFSFLMWLFAWMDAVNVSKRDVKNDKITKRNIAENKYQQGQEPQLLYTSWLGFAAGFLAQLPALIVTIVACIASESLSSNLSILLRVWNIPYMQVYSVFKGAIPYLFLIFPLFYTLVAGLAYLNGPVQQQRMETIIERNKAKSAKRVQDEKKGRKKNQRNSAYRR